MSHIKRLSTLSGVLKEIYEAGRIRDATVAHGFSVLMRRHPKLTADYLGSSRGMLTRQHLAYLQQQAGKSQNEQEAFGRAGTVYVLSLPAHPGIAKIGRTTMGGRERAEALSANANPQHVLRHEIAVADASTVELMVRSFLRPFQCTATGYDGPWTSSKGTEYFRIEIEHAKRLLDLAQIVAANRP